jgi:hypothetical protein
VRSEQNCFIILIEAIFIQVPLNDGISAFFAKSKNGFLVFNELIELWVTANHSLFYLIPRNIWIARYVQQLLIQMGLNV